MKPTYDLNGHTAQELFDLAMRGMASQGWERSARLVVDKINFCLYNGPDNTHCPVGWILLGLGLPMPMEEIGWSNIVSCGNATEAHKELLCDLQLIHDQGEESAYRAKYMQLARQYHLTFPEDC